MSKSTDNICPTCLGEEEIFPKQVMDKNKQKALSDALSKINKKFGAGTVTKASEAEEKLTKRTIKTPSIEFNNMLGGGMKAFVELYGPPSSGKTSMAIETLAYNQKQDPDFVGAWLETEGSITEEILKLHGVDMNRLVYWNQDDVDNAESALDVIRSLVASGAVDYVVINSIAGLAPKTEMEDDLEKQNIALVARLLSKFFRVITGIANKNKVTIVFINQVRDKVGTMFGNPETTTGGRAIPFYMSQRVRMNSVKIMANDPINETDGVKISCIVQKNRFAYPGAKAIYYANYETGIDNIVVLPTLLQEAGIVRQAGAWWYYEDANGQPLIVDGIECKFKSKNDFLEALRNNKTLREELMFKLDNVGLTVDTVSTEELAEIEAENKAIESEMAEIADEYGLEDDSE